MWSGLSILGREQSIKILQISRVFMLPLHMLHLPLWFKIYGHPNRSIWAEAPWECKLNHFSLTHILQLKVRFPRPYLGIQSQESLHVKASPLRTVHVESVYFQNGRDWKMVPESHGTEAFPCPWRPPCYFWKGGHKDRVREPPNETAAWIAAPSGGTELPSRCMSSGKEGKEETLVN